MTVDKIQSSYCGANSAQRSMQPCRTTNSIHRAANVRGSCIGCATTRHTDRSGARCCRYADRFDRFVLQHTKMADVGGVTELQFLEGEIRLLKKQLDGINKADVTSSSCARVIASIQAAEEKDGFIGGSMENNQFHTSAGAGGDGGCCTVM